jgi:transmembrane sensor
VHDNVDDLLLAADAARLSGHPARALPYLNRVLERHAHDDRAPMAAFTRGRILMTLGQPGEAGESFDRAMTLGAQGSLHENALARAVEAYSRAGNTTRAAKLAQSYAERYPEGRWRAAVRAHGGVDE